MKDLSAANDIETERNGTEDKDDREESRLAHWNSFRLVVLPDDRDDDNGS